MSHRSSPAHNPFIPNFAALDAAERRATAHLALGLFGLAALIILAIVAPVIVHDWHRISNAVCANETKV